MSGQASAVTSISNLQERIDALPRVPVAYKNTPLEKCERLAKSCDTSATVYIKRDDLTGVAFGGNKLRNLEFRLAEALESGADTLVLGVDILSNSARQTAGAANRLGLDLVLVLTGKEPTDAYSSNLLVDLVLGAEIHFVPDRDRQHEKMVQLSQGLEQAGKKPFVMTFSGLFRQASAIAYAECTLEILRDLEREGKTLDWLYMTSSGKGIAGPLVAAKALELSTRIVSASPSNTNGRTPHVAAEIASEVAEMLGLRLEFSSDDLEHSDEYAGDGYGAVTTKGLEAIRLLGNTEGILLDPVYTGKAFAKFADDLVSGKIGPGETAVFIHTGGQPLLFNYADDLTRFMKAG